VKNNLGKDIILTRFLEMYPVSRELKVLECIDHRERHRSRSLAKTNGHRPTDGMAAVLIQHPCRVLVTKVSRVDAFLC
jgi:hypothetical protein